MGGTHGFWDRTDGDPAATAVEVAAPSAKEDGRWATIYALDVVWPRWRRTPRWTTRR